jgi:hypothetical protein
MRRSGIWRYPLQLFCPDRGQFLEYFSYRKFCVRIVRILFLNRIEIPKSLAHFSLPDQFTRRFHGNGEPAIGGSRRLRLECSRYGDETQKQEGRKENAQSMRSSSDCWIGSSHHVPPTLEHAMIGALAMCCAGQSILSKFRYNPEYSLEGR